MTIWATLVRTGRKQTASATAKVTSVQSGLFDRARGVGERRDVARHQDQQQVDERLGHPRPGQHDRHGCDHGR